VYRFYTKNTIEEDLTKERKLEIQASAEPDVGQNFKRQIDINIDEKCVLAFQIISFSIFFEGFVFV
jgi:hypothetical protein